MVEKAVPILTGLATTNPYVQGAVLAGSLAYGAYQTLSDQPSQGQGHGHSHEPGSGLQMYQVDEQRQEQRHSQPQLISDADEELKQGYQPEEQEQEPDEEGYFSDEPLLYNTSEQVRSRQTPQEPGVNLQRPPFMNEQQQQTVIQEIAREVIQQHEEIKDQPEEEKQGYYQMVQEFVIDNVQTFDRDKLIKILSTLDGMKHIYDMYKEKNAISQITDQPNSSQYANLDQNEAQKILPPQCRREKYWDPQRQTMTYMIVCEDQKNDKILRRVYFPK